MTTHGRRRFLTQTGGIASALLAPGWSIALETGAPSRTAQSTALHRAAHQLLDRPIVFDDPVALRMLGAARVKWLSRNLDRYGSAASNATRAFLVTRSRYAEDELDRLYQQGVRQYMVLGAGLDTFAHRNPYDNKLHVFEVDHPSTQAWKRKRLAEQGMVPPRSLTFVDVDFERQSLAARLQTAGWRRNAPTFVSWLGVTMYLTRETTMRTFAFIAGNCAPGSEIVFDFMLPDHLLGDRERQRRATRASRVAKIGEPWIGHFDPQTLVNDLSRLGFTSVTHFGAAEANARYFAGRSDGLRCRGSARIMTARM
jgi:methyltransferase (TIGR00027 family)